MNTMEIQLGTWYTLRSYCVTVTKPPINPDKQMEELTAKQVVMRGAREIGNGELDKAVTDLPEQGGHALSKNGLATNAA